MKNEKDEEDDLITLSGFGQTTYWIFPSNITHCPVGRCKAVFEERFQAIQHYKQSHADISIVCPKCDRPVVARKRKDFLTHYARRHPGEEPPLSNPDANPNSSMSTTTTGTTPKPGRKVNFSWNCMKSSSIYTELKYVVTDFAIMKINFLFR